MNEDPKEAQFPPSAPKKLKLYIYGSCESDQYYHPRGDSESKRPICLSDIENFNMTEEDADPAQTLAIIPNPLFREEILKIACGALHTIVVSTEGTVYTFGCNDEGALGREGPEKIPTRVPLSDPIDLISAGDNHSVFANSLVGSIYFTGNYKYMRGESMADRVTTPIRYDIGKLDTRLKNQSIQKVVSGSNHSAILAGGKIFIRGEPEAHTMGRRINARHKVENSLNFDGLGLNKVEDLWCGGYHNIAKVKKGSTWHYFVWGLNRQGQLGLRTYEDIEYPQELQRFKGVNIIDVAAGTNFTIVLTEEGELYGCGQNDDGQLGLGENYVYQDSEQENELENEIENKMNLEEEKKEKKKEIAVEQKIEVDNKEIPACAESEKNVINENVESEKKEDAQKDVKINEESLIEKQDLKEHPKEELKEEKQVEEVVQEKDQIIIQKEHAGQQKKEEPEKPVVEHKVIEEKLPEVQQKMEIESPIQAVNPRMKEENIYIKSFKKISIDQKVSKIASGSEFSFGWNQKSLYSWGFGSNYVLLNGQQEDEVTPFKIKAKILNEHSIYDVAPGAQHVAYLSYPTSEKKPTPTLSETALENSRVAKRVLSRKKKI